MAAVAAERDAKIQDLATKNAEKDAKILEKDAKILEKDAKILEKDANIKALN